MIDFSKVRAMSMVDVPSVWAIERITYPNPWSESLFFDCLMVGYPAWVLDIDEQVSGYMILSFGAGECHILNLCIAPDAQGKGHGKAMLVHGLQFALKHGMKTVVLEVRPTNHIAIKLYQQFGFIKTGIRKEYYNDGDSKEDALVFQLELKKVKRLLK